MRHRDSVAGTSGGGRTRRRLANCGRYCRLTLTILFSHIGFSALVVGYALIGACVFSMLERPSCIRARLDAIERRDVLVTGLLRMTKNLTIIRLDDWRSEAKLLMDAYTSYLGEIVKKRGYDGKDEDEQSKWDFLQSLLYSVIVITTIGYGDAVPKTDQGKLATILYAIIGIPLMLVFLSTLGDIMAHAFKFFYWKVCCTICFRPRVKRVTKKQRRRRKERRRLRSVRRQEKAKMAALAALSTIQQQPFTVASHLLPLPDSTSGLAGATTPPPTAVVSTPQRQTSSSGTSGSTNAAESGTPFRFPRSSSPIDPVYVNRYALQHERPVDFTIQTVPQSSYSSHLPPRLNRQSNVQLSTLDSLDSPGSLTLTSPVSPELQRRLLDDLQRQLDLCCSDTDSDSEPDEREYTNVPIPVCLALVVGYICGGAFLFLELQQSWNFEESAYFCFITLTTIGFGDYLPKAEDIAIRDSKGALILCSLYTILGMAWIAMCFNLVQEEVARIVKSFATMIGLVSKQHDR